MKIDGIQGDGHQIDGIYRDMQHTGYAGDEYVTGRVERMLMTRSDRPGKRQKELYRYAMA